MSEPETFAVLREVIHSDPYHMQFSPLLIAYDAAIKRAEAAEADARSAWVEYAAEKETSAQCLSYLRQSEDMVDALEAERDALRKVYESAEDFIGAQGTAYESDQYLMLCGMVGAYNQNRATN